MTRAFMVLALALPTLSGAAVVPEGVVPGHAFERYTITTPGQPTAVTFYLSTGADPARPRPLVVWVQGTGCESHFSGRQGGVPTGGLLTLVRTAAGQDVIAMGVEKPGVPYLHAEPRRLQDCPADFLRDFTLDHWAATIAAAIAAARALPGIDPTRVLVMGHSEGGIVAMRVSNVAPGVTHAASLAGGGLAYLFHIAEYVRGTGGNPDEDVYRCWAQVRAAPTAIDRFCWGGTYRQWASFMATSILREALASRARLCFVHGSADSQNTITGFDALRAELSAAGREAVFERLEGADHALDLPGHTPPEGLQATFGRVVRWFAAR